MEIFEHTIYVAENRAPLSRRVSRLPSLTHSFCKTSLQATIIFKALLYDKELISEILTADLYGYYRILNQFLGATT